MKRWIKRGGITLGVLGTLALCTFLFLNVLLLIPIQGEPSTELWFTSDEYIPEAVTTLQFQDGEDFKVLLLSDIQLDISLPLKNKRALNLITDLVERTEPDLIMTTGDNTSWVFSGYMARKLTKFFDSLETPWAVTFGNHDGESRRDKNWHGNVYESGEYSLFSMGPSTIPGVGNYTIRIEEDGKSAMLLVMLDSHDRREYPDGSDYDFIHPNQIEWYKAQIRGESEYAYGSFGTLLGKAVPSLAFFHIPLPEYQQMIDLWNAGELNPLTTYGEAREGAYAPPVNTGLFEVMKDLKSTEHVFVGHDHVNNLSGLYDGIRLSYGLKTGPVSYYHEDLQGGTLITIEQESHNVKITHLYKDDEGEN